MCLEIDSGTTLFITNFLGPSHGLVNNIDKFDRTKCNIISSTGAIELHGLIQETSAT